MEGCKWSVTAVTTTRIENSRLFGLQVAIYLVFIFLALFQILFLGSWADHETAGMVVSTWVDCVSDTSTAAVSNCSAYTASLSGLSGCLETATFDSSTATWSQPSTSNTNCAPVVGILGASRIVPASQTSCIPTTPCTTSAVAMQGDAAFIATTSRETNYSCASGSVGRLSGCVPSYDLGSKRQYIYTGTESVRVNHLPSMKTTEQTKTAPRTTIQRSDGSTAYTVPEGSAVSLTVAEILGLAGANLDAANTDTSLVLDSQPSLRITGLKILASFKYSNVDRWSWSTGDVSCTLSYSYSGAEWGQHYDQQDYTSTPSTPGVSIVRTGIVIQTVAEGHIGYSSIGGYLRAVIYSAVLVTMAGSLMEFYLRLDSKFAGDCCWDSKGDEKFVPTATKRSVESSEGKEESEELKLPVQQLETYPQQYPTTQDVVLEMNDLQLDRSFVHAVPKIRGLLHRETESKTLDREEMTPRTERTKRNARWFGSMRRGSTTNSSREVKEDVGVGAVSPLERKKPKDHIKQDRKKQDKKKKKKKEQGMPEMITV